MKTNRNVGHLETPSTCYSTNTQFLFFFASYSKQITYSNGYIAILKDELEIVSKTVLFIIVTRYNLSR